MNSYRAMEIKVTPGYEESDAEALAQMKQSRAFGLYLKRINAELERNRNMCEAYDGTGLYRAQGTVSGLRTAIGLVDTLIQEARTNGR
jgi:hypothetical protein